MEIQKAKYNGQKIKVRKLEDDEVIHERCLIKNTEFNDGKLMLTKCVGETICDHPRWEYFEVLSNFAIL